MALIFCSAMAGGWWFGTRTVFAVPQEQQSGDKKAPADAVGTQAPTPAAVTPTVAKPVDHAKKVITNDDIKSSPFASYGGLFYFNTGSINDCDANCFDQVRLFANQFDVEKNPNWRREVLQQIESVRSDSEWQAYLHQLYDAHNAVCHVTFDKQDEMRRFGNSRNMGPQEIDITEKYDSKMKTAQEQLAAVAAQQPAQQKKFTERPYANSFAMVQGLRMQGGYCSQWRVTYPQ
ncbi:MAG: hypothetical protein ACLPZF_11470 [Candidatus Acidiferrales bacterium]